MHGDLAQFADLAACAILADDGDLMARYRFADQPRFDHAERGRRAKHQIAFGLAVKFVDRQPELFLPPSKGFRAQGLATRCYGPQGEFEMLTGIFDGP